MNGYCKLLLAPILLSASSWLFAATSPTIQTPARNAHTTATTKINPETPVIQLGKVNVNAMRVLIQTLQGVKVALKIPFDDNPKHVDEMVCRLHAGVVDSEPWLECGNQDWFARRRDQTQMGLTAGGWSNGGLQMALDANTPEMSGASSEYGHPWHTVRFVNRRQIIYFRQILNALPEPGKGNVVVVDAKGKTMLTVKAQSPSGPGGSN